MEENSKNEVKSSLEDLLNYDLPDEVDGLEEEHNLPNRTIREVPTQDQGITLARNKAKKTMDSLLKFYLSEQVIEEHEYIKAKKRIDEMALGMLIRQMENSEEMISILMDTIHGGDVQPRMFEVLSDLQRTLLDIIKSQTMYMVAVEENAKKLARDVDVYQGSSQSSSKSSGGSTVKQRGQKDLMRALQQSITDEEAEEIEDSDGED